jgi:hypothetical protein
MQLHFIDASIWLMSEEAACSPILAAAAIARGHHVLPVLQTGLAMALLKQVSVFTDLSRVSVKELFDTANIMTLLEARAAMSWVFIEVGNRLIQGLAEPRCIKRMLRQQRSVRTISMALAFLDTGTIACIMAAVASLGKHEVHGALTRFLQRISPSRGDGATGAQDLVTQASLTTTHWALMGLLRLSIRERADVRIKLYIVARLMDDCDTSDWSLTCQLLQTAPAPCLADILKHTLRPDNKDLCEPVARLLLQALHQQLAG